jgi:hypothetical protein
MRQARAAALAVACLLLAGACGTQGTSTSGEVLRFLTNNLPQAATGEPYSQEVVLTAGTRPYNLRVVEGALPPGLGIQGRTIAGTPREAKAYSFTLEASDANLSIVQREFTLNVIATPAKALLWTLPPTDVRGEIRIPVQVRSPRGVTAFRATVPLPAGVRFVRVEPGEGRPLLLTKVEGNNLRVDGAFRDTPTSSKDVTALTLVLQSDNPVRLTGTLGFDLRAANQSLARAEVSRTAQPGTTGTTGTTGTPGTTGTDGTTGTNGTTGTAPTTAPETPTTPPADTTPDAPVPPETPEQPGDGEGGTQ